MSTTRKIRNVILNVIEDQEDYIDYEGLPDYYDFYTDDDYDTKWDRQIQEAKKYLLDPNELIEIFIDKEIVEINKDYDFVIYGKVFDDFVWDEIGNKVCKLVLKFMDKYLSY